MAVSPLRKLPYSRQIGREHARLDDNDSWAKAWTCYDCLLHVYQVHPRSWASIFSVQKNGNSTLPHSLLFICLWFCWRKEDLQCSCYKYKPMCSRHSTILNNVEISFPLSLPYLRLSPWILLNHGNLHRTLMIRTSRPFKGVLWQLMCLNTHLMFTGPFLLHDPYASCRSLSAGMWQSEAVSEQNRTSL